MTRVLVAVVENVGVPVGAYLLFTMLGWQAVWALVGAAGVSVLILAVQYLRRRELTVLGVLVLARFALGVPVALLTADARVELAKDFIITGAVGLVAAATLLTPRPLIARIRRDLAADATTFDRRWREDAGFRALHRRLTFAWTLSLGAEAALAILLIYTLPLTLAVITTSIMAPAVLLTLISVTEWRARRYTMTCSLHGT